LTGTTAVAPKPTSKRKRRLRIALIALGVFLILLVVSVELTSTSKFCGVCHNMKPFYKSWQESSHKDVACKNCHYPPGLKSLVRTKMQGLVMLVKYLTRVYGEGKPLVQISDEACLRPGCHDTRLLKGRVQYGQVSFDHTSHLGAQRRGEKLRCASCHAQMVQGTHMAVTPTTCFLCHFKPALEPGAEAPPKDCALCHRQDELVDKSRVRFDHTPVYAAGFACEKCHSRVVTGDGAVARENCYKCHLEPARLAKYADTALLHRTHISQRKIDCAHCHAGIQHKIVKDAEALSDCRACHTGTHRAQEILFTGQGGAGTPHPVPNVMLEKGLNCQGCHVLHQQTGRLLKSGTLRSNPAVCESCHGKGYARILKNWEAATDKRLVEARAVLASASAEIAGRGGPARPQARALLEEAAFNIEIVTQGKAAHNVDYAQQLLAASLAKIGEALAAVGSPVKVRAPLILNQAAANACSACHAGIEEMSGPVFGLTFPHRPHVVRQKMECARCHSNEKRHGELTANKATCAPCHHKPPQKDCGACHASQKTVYQGGRLGTLIVPRDVMAEAEIGCADCHLDKAKAVRRPGPEACAACHGEDKYKAVAEEQKTAIRRRLDDLRAALHESYRSRPAGAEPAAVLKAEDLVRAAEADGSGGAHNFRYFESALAAAAAEVRAGAEKTPPIRQAP
jgi:nitrate/TMAO reductase-like tetraheme cytochrome c subunit